MKSINLKTLLCVAGVLGVSALGAGVQAQGTNLLSLAFDEDATVNKPVFISTYTFSGSMIVNSIGLYTGGASPVSLSWARNDGAFVDITNQSYSVDGNLRWYTINESFTNASSLNVKTEFATSTTFGYVSDQTLGLPVSFTNLASSDGSLFNDGSANTNIRVSNPGSNIAPEPGTFALALTGGAALAGVGLRRRRRAS
jgi:hypothetical protein